MTGGAILPKGGVLGYGLATTGELICDMLWPATVECNTFLLIVDTGRYREASALQNAAEAILDHLRNCPPADGFERVEVPGERETSRRAASAQLNSPVPRWQALCAGPGSDQPVQSAPGPAQGIGKPVIRPWDTVPFCKWTVTG